MKAPARLIVSRRLRFFILVFAIAVFAASAARAGLTFDLHLIRSSQGESYYFYTEISTNDTPPAAPLGNYYFASPQQPSGGSWRQVELTADGLDFIGGGSSGYNNFDSVMDQITNGNWTLTFTNATTTNHLEFAVNAVNVTSNELPALMVNLPVENEILTIAQPTFTWEWTNPWGVNSDAFVFNNDYSFFQYGNLPATQNNWPVPAPLPSGGNLHFQLRYQTNSPTAFFVATTPLDTVSAQPISGWVSTAILESGADVNFSANLPDAAGGHTNLAYYSFEDGDIFATDYSPNGNDVSTISSFGGGSAYTTNSETIGDYAAFFLNNGGSGASWLSPPTNLLATLAGSFSVSLWINTTQTTGSDDDDGLFGNAGLVSAFNGPGGNWVVPMAITGNKLAFATGGSPQSTLHSATDINTGYYVHLVVTRDQATGEKKIYVDGELDATETGSTDLLDSPTALNIGYNNGTGFDGRMDEIQIYSGVLNATEVDFLYNNPDSAVPDVAGGSVALAEAVDATDLVWTTGGDADWFGQTTTTHDGVDAAQSGPLPVGDYDHSYIETTVTGPGTLTFWWQNVVNDDYLYTDFYIDGDYQNESYGENGWSQDGPYEIGPGTHTLYWETYDDGTDDPSAAAFLDEVVFTPTAASPQPVITFQPIDQTNYPGYPVNLVADAISNPEANWQWYRVDSGLIPGATSRDYSPTNAGTAAVAGSYYAIADNGIGLASTRVAIVTFVSAALPPDWTKAFQTQLTGNFDNPRTNYGIATLVDASGNVYAANSFTGTNYFASATFISGPGRFASGLFKHSATGTALWGQAITNNGSGNSYPQCLAHAPGDGVYMSGVYFGTNSIGTNTLPETAASALYLARFDSAGNVLWVRTFGGTNSQFQSYHQLVADPAGNVTISALGNGLVDFGTTNLVVDGQKGVLAQYDADGNIRWVAKPSGWVQYMTYVAGRIYACFNASETNDIGGLTNTTDRKFVLAALNATNGQALWLQGFGSSSGNGNPLGYADDLPAVSISSSNVFLTGTAWGPGATFGAVSVSWPEINRQYFARYDTNGTAELAVSFGGTNVWPWAAAADATGNVYVTGDFNGYASFGDKTIGAARYGGIGDAYYGQTFLAKFDRDGNSLWVRQAQSETPGSYVNVRDINLAPDGVWICGFVNDYGDFGTNRVYGPVTVVGSPIGYLYYYTGGFLANVTEGGMATALPVTLLNPQRNSTNFLFSFQSQSGFTHRILYRTNLAAGIWQTNSTITGNGSITNVSLPFSLFSPAKQGFIRVSTE